VTFSGLPFVVNAMLKVSIMRQWFQILVDLIHTLLDMLLLRRRRRGGGSYAPPSCVVVHECKKTTNKKLETIVEEEKDV